MKISVIYFIFQNYTFPFFLSFCMSAYNSACTFCVQFMFEKARMVYIIVEILVTKFISLLTQYFLSKIGKGQRGRGKKKLLLSPDAEATTTKDRLKGTKWIHYWVRPGQPLIPPLFRPK